MSKSEKPTIEDLVPEYRQIIRRQTEAALKLAAVRDQEFSFRQQCKKLGLDVSFLNPIPLRYLGSINNPNSYVSCLVRQAMKSGHLMF